MKLSEIMVIVLLVVLVIIAMILMVSVLIEGIKKKDKELFWYTALALMVLITIVTAGILFGIGY